MSTAMQEWPRRHRITVDHYYRMAELGLFGANGRVELIEGEVIDMPPMGSRHAATLEHLGALVFAAVGDRAIVRQQLPVRLSGDSEPEPDIAVVAPRADRYRSAHPTPDDVWLLVEISGATLRYDIEVKVPLYARCGIPEVWAVDLASSHVRVFRLLEGGRYASEAVAASSVAIERLPDAEIDLGILLGGQFRGS